MIKDAWHPTAGELLAIDVHQLLPQQEPFVMIDRLAGFDSAATVTETDVREPRIFVERGRLTAAGLIENIAQTCAARIGYVNRYILGKDVQIGFIGAIRDMRIAAAPAAGSTIVTRVKVLEEVFGMTLAEAVVTDRGRTVAEAQMKIAIQQG